MVEIMRLNQMGQADPSVLEAKFKKIGPVEVQPNTLAEDLGRLRKDEKTYDIFFNVRKKKKGAHLVILAARCGIVILIPCLSLSLSLFLCILIVILPSTTEYFQALVRSGDAHKEEPSDVVIGSIVPTPEAYDHFLDYLYTGISSYFFFF